MSDTVTLKRSKRKFGLIMALIFIIAGAIFVVVVLIPYFMSPNLRIWSFNVEKKPWGSEGSVYHNTTTWVLACELTYAFGNFGWGAAESVKVVGACYDSSGVMIESSEDTKDFGTVSPGNDVTADSIILVSPQMYDYRPPTIFKISLYQGNTIVDEWTLPY
jgi:hypothetical protein